MALGGFGLRENNRYAGWLFVSRFIIEKLGKDVILQELRDSRETDRWFIKIRYYRLVILFVILLVILL